MTYPVPIFQLGNTPDPRYSATLISDWQQLPDEAGVLIITDIEQQDAQLEALHRSQRFWRWRIYTSQPSAFSSALSDGDQIPEDLDAVWQAHLSSLSAIKEGNVYPMLAWLWLDEKRRLLPVRQPSLAAIYRYPLLEAYSEDGAAPSRALLQMTQRGYLEEGDLVDKVRYCPVCQSGHINYVETCPSCHGIDIVPEQSLHCFTCGHVAGQDTFTRSGKLICPNCLTQLRHIGVDYDRPLENFACNSCHYRFTDAETKARCMTCDTYSLPNELIARQIYQYDTGPQTSSLLRRGHTFQVPVLSLNALVDTPFLFSLLPWLNKLAKRHQQPHLILALHLPGLEGYSQHHGELKMLDLTEQLSERLNGMLRDTDICCQYLPDTLLLVMPNTPESALGVLQQKIENLASLIETEDFTLRVYAWSLPDEALSEDAASWLAFKMNEIGHE